MAQPLPPHLMQTQQNQNLNQSGPSTTGVNHTNSFPANPTASSSSQSASAAKAPYGSGDSDDGYSLVFKSLAAFHEWRLREEETQMVEFVKGDTHGSKAVPPRFKDHTKLVCARHSRSGRKKYVKKHPERVRKVPSRKLEGTGCPASISFKTYFDTDEVRACYMSQHSHEIGLANLPFTRRGRKAAVEQEKDRTKRHSKEGDSSVAASPVAGPNQPQNQSYAPILSAHPFHQPPPAPHPYGHPPQPLPGPTTDPTQAHAMAQPRWDRMNILFSSIREHARAFEYPGPSVAALEGVLLRLFLESPLGAPGPVPGMPQPGVGNPSASNSGNGVNGAGSGGMTSGSEGP